MSDLTKEAASNIVDNYVNSRCFGIAMKHNFDCDMVQDIYDDLRASSPWFVWSDETSWEFLDEQIAKIRNTLGDRAKDLWEIYGSERLINIVKTMDWIKEKGDRCSWEEAYNAFRPINKDEALKIREYISKGGTKLDDTFEDLLEKHKNEPDKEEPISTGSIPVEYNLYKELIEKAAKYDKIMDYIRKQEHANAEKQGAVIQKSILDSKAQES